MLVDSHFHLDLMDNMKSLIGEFRKTDVGIIAVGTTPLAYKRELQFTNNVNNIKVGLGLHPQLIRERSHEISQLLDDITKANYLGEIGLDFNGDYIDSKEQQISCLREIASACANVGGKVLSIHSVKSAKCLLEILEEERVFQSCRCIFHWFSGNDSERRLAIDRGAYFSINPKMLKTKNGQDTIKIVPKEKILLETDAPFAMQIDSAETLKKELEKLVRSISDIRKEDLINQIEENSEKIFQRME